MGAGITLYQSDFLTNENKANKVNTNNSGVAKIPCGM